MRECRAVNAVWINEDSVDVRLTRDELLLLNNALNEVCNGVDFCDAEFHARLGVNRSEGQKLLSQIGETFRSSSKASQ